METPRLAVLVTAVLLAPLGAGAQSWSVAAPLQEARQEVAVAELGGLVYVIGGFRGNLSIADTVEVYDPALDQWSFGPALPTPVHHAAAVSVGGLLYVIGGWPDFFATPLDTVYAFDPGTAQWTQRASMPTARAGLAAAVLDGKIYAAGGSPAARENDFAVYDPQADSWTTLPSMPTPRNHLAAGASEGLFFAVGGRSGSGTGGITSALEAFDPVAGAWSARKSMPTARGGLAATVFGRYLLVLGGEGNEGDPDGVFDETESYDPVADTWTSLTPMPTPRHGIGAALAAGQVHVPGGGPIEGFSVTNVHEVFDPALELPSDCEDGIDNDGDELIDWPDDPACRDADWPREHAKCQDGDDNDGDGSIDFDGGASIHGAPQAPIDLQCTNKPWRNKERIGCGLGFELLFVLMPLAGWRRRAGRRCADRGSLRPLRDRASPPLPVESAGAAASRAVAAGPSPRPGRSHSAPCSSTNSCTAGRGR